MNTDHHDSNRQYYDRIATAYDTIANSSERAARQTGIEALDLKPGEAVLELGFGTCYDVLELATRVGADPDRLLDGVDVPISRIVFAAKLSSLQFKRDMRLAKRQKRS